MCTGIYKGLNKRLTQDFDTWCKLTFWGTVVLKDNKEWSDARIYDFRNFLKR